MLARDKGRKSIKVSERFDSLLFFLAASMSVTAIVTICAFLIAEGLPVIQNTGLNGFVLSEIWRPSEGKFGLLPMILGTVYVTSFAALIAVPIGVLTAAFMAKLCPLWLYKIFKTAISVLASIPSVVYGFFGLVTVAPMSRNLFGGEGTSMLSASLVLALMMLPTVTIVSESAIRAAAEESYHSALALGIDKVRSLFFVVLPSAKKGIASAAALGIARAVGETTAVMMVSGNQARMPQSLLKGVRTITANIALEIGYAADEHRAALAASALLLFAAVLSVNILIGILERRKR